MVGWGSGLYNLRLGEASLLQGMMLGSGFSLNPELSRHRCPGVGPTPLPLLTRVW